LAVYDGFPKNEFMFACRSSGSQAGLAVGTGTLGVQSGEGLAFNFGKSLDFGWFSKIFRRVMIAGIADKNPYPGWRHHRIATPQAIVVHEIGRWNRPYRMVIGDNHFPARRKFMPMSMKTTIRMSAKTRIGAPMAGHPAKVAFMRPDRLALEGPK
jgi:hypothetical protein